MCGTSSLFGQDTIYVDDSSMGGVSKYYARDSIYADLKKKQLHLFGEAFVESEEMNLKAGYIIVDMELEEVRATHVFDEEGNMIEKPVFNMGGEEVVANSLKYNLKSNKAYIEAVRIQQDEMHLHMGRAKRHPNEEIHFVEGKFTTCNLDEPHFHFQLSRAVMIPNKRIVTGPMNLYIAGVPTPLGLPFSLLPQKDKQDRTHGVLFPEINPTSRYGFGLRNLGYYIPINDRLQTSVFGTLYSRGSWGLRNSTDYAKRYGYTGNFDVSYDHMTYGYPDDVKNSNMRLKWVHRKDPKSNPKWNFNTDINFESSNNSKVNLDQLNQNYFKNTLRSDVNITRAFPGKPFQMSGKIALSQNSQTRNISLTSPIINFSTSQFFPFKNVSRKEIFQRFGIIYNIEGQNKSTFKDSLLTAQDYRGIGDQFMYGMRQRLTLQTTGGILKKKVKITPSFNYGTDLNFQQIRRNYDTANSVMVTDTLKQAGLAHTMSFNMSATTVVYSYYKFVGKNKPVMRHVLTPNASFSYRPLLTDNLTTAGAPSQPDVVYSAFQNSVYAYSATKTQALVNFGINNTFELKRKSDKDTITGYQKIRLIDAFSITGNYDLMKDSFNLSDINMNLRITPFKWLNFTGNALYSFYGWDEVTKRRVNNFALSNNGQLGRFMNLAFNTAFVFTSKEGRKQIEENRSSAAENWQADYNYFYLYPERIIDFRIPWKVNLSHQFNLSRNVAITPNNPDEFAKIHTVSLDADLSITKRWKLGTTIYYDLKNTRITNALVTLNRDMHCWALSFRWVPIGMNKSFMLTIRNTSSMFKDAKLDFRKPPALL